MSHHVDKWIKNLNIKTDILSLKEDNIRETLEDRYRQRVSKQNLGCPRNNKNQQVGSHQIKKKKTTFCTAKEINSDKTIHRTGKTHSSGKGLISRYTRAAKMRLPKFKDLSNEEVQTATKCMKNAQHC